MLLFSGLGLELVRDKLENEKLISQKEFGYQQICFIYEECSFCKANCFVMVVGSFQLKNAFSETGYPAFYRWEQSLKEMKWFCPPITILT